MALDAADVSELDAYSRPNDKFSAPRPGNEETCAFAPRSAHLIACNQILAFSAIASQRLAM
jgi:hypothetical protein